MPRALRVVVVVVVVIRKNLESCCCGCRSTSSFAREIIRCSLLCVTLGGLASGPSSIRVAPLSWRPRQMCFDPGSLEKDERRVKFNCSADSNCDYAWGCCRGCVDQWFLVKKKGTCPRCQRCPDTMHRLTDLPGQLSKCWVLDMKRVEGGWIPAVVL